MDAIAPDTIPMMLVTTITGPATKPINIIDAKPLGKNSPSEGMSINNKRAINNAMASGMHARASDHLPARLNLRIYCNSFALTINTFQ